MVDQQLLRRMDDLAARAANSGFAVSKFLTDTEAAAVARYFARRGDVSIETTRSEGGGDVSGVAPCRGGVALRFEGGFANAERVRAVFHTDSYERDTVVAAFTVRPSADVGHRDILGALMGLGIARDTVGDCTSSALVCTPDVAPLVAEQLMSAGRASLRLTRISADALPEKVDDYTIKTDTVASLRLDALVATAFGLARGRAVELIQSGLVSLDHVVCDKPSREAAEGATLSVRGMGRARLQTVGGLSKKGRIFIQIAVYKR